VIRIIV